MSRADDVCNRSLPGSGGSPLSAASALDFTSTADPAAARASAVLRAVTFVYLGTGLQERPSWFADNRAKYAQKFVQNIGAILSKPIPEQLRH